MATTVNLNDYMNTVLNKILGNQNLCKYLYYDSDEPLSESDIADTSILSDKNNTDRRIYTIPFNPDTHSSQRTTIHILIGESDSTNSTFYKNISIKFIILSYNELWELYDAGGAVILRPNAIIDELHTLFNREKSIGLGNTNFSSIKPIYMNEYVSGYELTYKNIDFTQNT